MKRFHFSEKYERTELYKDYDQAYADVTAFVRSSGDDLIVLDFSGVTFLGYSYSKATVVPAIQLAVTGSEGGKRVVVYAGEGLDISELTAALERFKQAVIILSTPGGKSADGHIVGALPEHLLDTWSVVAGHDGATTAEISELIEESLQNTNQRLKKLNELGLIRRQRTSSPSGGWEWINKLP